MYNQKALEIYELLDLALPGTSRIRDDNKSYTDKNGRIWVAYNRPWKPETVIGKIQHKEPRVGTSFYLSNQEEVYNNEARITRTLTIATSIGAVGVKLGFGLVPTLSVTASAKGDIASHRIDKLLVPIEFDDINIPRPQSKGLNDQINPNILHEWVGYIPHIISSLKPYSLQSI